MTSKHPRPHSPSTMIKAATWVGQLQGVKRAAFAALLGNPRHEVADVDHPAGIVEGLMIDGKPRMLRLAKHAHHFFDRDIVFDRQDVGAWHHHVFDCEFVETQDTQQHAALLSTQRIAVAAGELILDPFAKVRSLAKAKLLHHALEPRRVCVGAAGLLGLMLMLG